MSATFKAYSEKRNFIRMKVDTMVTFKIDGNKEIYDAQCVNLSGAGLLIETSKKLQSGSKVRITVPSENNDYSNLKALAEVIRVRHIPDQHKYSVGLAIQQILS